MKGHAAFQHAEGAAVQELSDFSKLLAESATLPGSMNAILSRLCEMFAGEGARMYLLEPDRPVLKLEHTFQVIGPHPAPWQEEGLSRLISFGEGFIGEVWSKQQPSLLPLPDADVTLSDLAFPLIADGHVVGAVEIVRSQLVSLSKIEHSMISVLSAELGLFMTAQQGLEILTDSQQRLQRVTAAFHVEQEELKRAKVMLSNYHDDLGRYWRGEEQFLDQLSHAVRTQLNGIVGVLDLFHRTQQNPQQQEYLAIIGKAASDLMNAVEGLVEKNIVDKRLFVSEASPLAKPIRGKREPRSAREVRLLVVTGLIGSAEFIESYATASGIECQCVSRGESALIAMRQAIAAERPFDMAFVERVLPDMDALYLAKAIKQDDQMAMTKLVLVSTFGAGGPQDKALMAGFAGHIAKPVKQAHLIHTIEALLKGAQLKGVVETHPAGGRPVILVAEDNPVNQQVTLLQLKELGYWAEVVTNGVEAVEAAKYGHFAAILMDCQMPEMDGMEATRRIRELEKDTGAHVPIIAMTARAMPEDRQKCIDAGMDDYMSKPITYDELSDSLSKYLDTSATVTENEDTMTHSAKNEPEESRAASSLSKSLDGEPIDLPMLENLLGVEETKEILGLFVTSGQELMDKIATAMATRDLGAVKDAGHTLKGTCSSIGANQLWSTCIALEKAAVAGDWAALADAHDELKTHFVQAKNFIDKLLG